MLNKLSVEAGKLARALPAQHAFKPVVYIGGSLLAIQDAVYGDIICAEDASLTHCELLHQLADETSTADHDEYVQILGMGYANIIRQQVVRHEADELAHIENVLQGELKEKTHRNLKSQEEFSYSEQEKSQETETDTKSSSRFELSKETSKIVNEQQQFEAGVSVSAGWGPVSIEASLGYSIGSSSTEAASTSVSMSKSITERAVNRIQERSLEIRETRSVNEVEVTNLHKVDNVDGTDHIKGLYYWVDKVYENQVYNVGKRLMLEFMIPEPAAYHIYSMSNAKRQGVTLEKPIHPKDYNGSDVNGGLRSFQDITRANYHVWAAKYDVQDIAPPPMEIQTVSSAYALDYVPESKSWHDYSFKDLKVPEGYEADFARLSVGISGGSGRYLAGFVGNRRFTVTSMAISPLILALNQETDLVPFSFRGHYNEYNINLEVVCKVSETGYDSWRIKTYNSIIAAYNQKQLEYDSQLAQLETAVTIQGQNPALNREVEKSELKKWALEMMTLQRFDGFNSMKKASNGAPEIDFDEALNEGKFVKFFEQSIEWHNMTYLFYPYFWANKQRWTTLKQLDDTDQKFTKFLQAGYARVVVPVHPKFTAAILHYFNTGIIWNGQDLPALDDDLYLSIVEEIQEMEDNTDGDPVGDSWETRVPTNLVIIDSTVPSNLPGS